MSLPFPQDTSVQLSYSSFPFLTPALDNYATSNYVISNSNILNTKINTKQDTLTAATNLLGVGSAISALDYNKITINKPSFFPADWNSTIANKPSIYTQTEVNNLLSAKEQILTFNSPLTRITNTIGINLNSYTPFSALLSSNYATYTGLNSCNYITNSTNSLTNYYNTSTSDGRYTQSNFTPSFTQLNSCNYITNATTGLTNYTRTGLDGAYLLKSGGSMSGALTTPNITLGGTSGKINVVDDYHYIDFNQSTDTTTIQEYGTIKFNIGPTKTTKAYVNSTGLTATAFYGDGANITNVPYSTITSKPTNFQSDWNTTIINKPIIYTQTEVNNLLNAKQATLTFSSPLVNTANTITFNESVITTLTNFYNKTETNNLLNAKQATLTFSSPLVNTTNTITFNESVITTLTNFYNKTEANARYLQLTGGTMSAGANIITTGNIRAGSLTAGETTYQLLINPPTATTSSLIQTILQGTGYNQKLTLQALGGNVGIGNTNPSQILQVGDGGRLRISNGTTDYSLLGTKEVDNADNTRIVCSGRDRTLYNGNIDYVATTTGAHQFYSSNETLRMRINNLGNVGIGIGNANTRLHIEHASTSSAGSSGGLYVYNPNNAASHCSVVGIRIAGALADKALLSFDVNGVAGWSIYTKGNDASTLRFNNSWAGTGTDILAINTAEIILNKPTTINGTLTATAITLTSSTTAVYANNASASSIFLGIVGVGTLSPAAKLHVASGSTSTGNIFQRYLSIILGDGTATQTLTDVCAIFDSSVWTKSKFTTSSDERIKKNIQDINDDTALQKILLIQPKTYEYIDKVERGNDIVYGFIAQQIKEVIPEAVKIEKCIIPNIYKFCNYINDVISLPPEEINKLKINDEIEIIIEDDNNKRLVKIIEINDDDNTIKINESLNIIKTAKEEEEIIDQVEQEEEVEEIIADEIPQETKECFVYGSKVDDFHTLDKTYIFTLNVCATQELYKIIQLQEERIRILEEKLASF